MYLYIHALKTMNNFIYLYKHLCMYVQIESVVVKTVLVKTVVQIYNMSLLLLSHIFVQTFMHVCTDPACWQHGCHGHGRH